MTHANSSQVVTNQTEAHPDLEALVRKHLQHSFSKPYSGYNETEFERVIDCISRDPRPVIFDSCCGVGESTVKLARAHPNHWVFGFDQSAKRTEQVKPESLPDNARVIRADVIDIWRLAVAEGLHLDKHFLLYPNPWPKKKHLKRRWHGHPVFSSLIELGGTLILRSNWPMYIEEFDEALELAGIYERKCSTLNEIDPLTPFERKYRDSGHKLQQLIAELD